jgi:hypothetical protein
VAPARGGPYLLFRRAPLEQADARARLAADGAALVVATRIALLEIDVDIWR